MKKLILTLLFMGAIMSQEKFYGFEFVKESGGIKEYTICLLYTSDAADDP